MTTRIVDLPENAVNMPALHPISNSIGNNTYTPMNIHPNPYGYDDATNTGGITSTSSRDNSIRGLDSVPIPNNVNEENGGLTPEQIELIQNTPKHKMPSRDIHLSRTEYTHDDKIHANYIPPLPISTTYDRERDYIKEHENEKSVKHNAEIKKPTSLIDHIYNIIQFPLMISILYFIFQYPLIDLVLFHRIDSFFKIYGSDQNLNFYGNVVKSVLFGFLFFVLFWTREYISRFQYVE
jgi:hypothetical protein